MRRISKPVTFGLVVGSREFFNGAPALASREQVLAQFDALNIRSITHPVEATKNGAVQSREDARLYAELFRKHREEIDGLVILLPNFGDEIAIAELLNFARLDVPILLQASNDEIDKVDVHSRRDAFCGKISVTNNFYQYCIRFTDTTTHTCDVDSAAFRADLDSFARVCRTVGGLRNARIGAIGARTGPFQTMRYSEKLLQAAGLTVVTDARVDTLFWPPPGVRPDSITATAHAPALSASSMSGTVSPTLTTAAGGYTPSCSMHRKSIHGAGRPAGTSSAHTTTSVSSSTIRDLRSRAKGNLVEILNPPKA